MTVQGDELELELAVVNLLNNAREACPKEGSVGLTLDLANETVRISVVNTYPSADEVDIKALCEPFSSSKAAGLGLGIPIVKSIAEAHGGRADFRAEAGVFHADITLAASTAESGHPKEMNHEQRRTAHPHH